jgi:hypothetical protein
VFAARRRSGVDNSQDGHDLLLCVLLRNMKLLFGGLNIHSFSPLIPATAGIQTGAEAGSPLSRE